eukprot:gene1053-1141_t
MSVVYWYPAEDIPIPFLLFLSLLCFTLAICIQIWYVDTSVKGIPLIVPAHYGWPLFRNFFDFSPSKQLESLLTYSKRYGDYVQLYIGWKKVILITDVSLVKELLLKRPRIFRRAKSLDPVAKITQISAGSFHSNGQLWSKIRRLTAPSFSMQNVQSMASIIFQEVDVWVEHLENAMNDHGKVEMREESMAFTLRVITSTAFGLDHKAIQTQYFYSQTFRDDVSSFFQITLHRTRFPFPDCLWRFTPLYAHEKRTLITDARMTLNCKEVLDYKRSLFPSDDVANPHFMIDHLIAAERRKGLTEDEVLANIKTFYIAGSETTSTVITWSCFYLSFHPDIAERLWKEVTSCDPFLERHTDTTIDQILSLLPLAQAVTKEVLRLQPPVALLSFQLEDDFESFRFANGLEVEAGEEVWVNFYGLMHKPNVYHRPDAFDPDRWLQEKDETQRRKLHEHWLPFGYGPRICPGMNLALTEATIALALLVSKFHIELAIPLDESQRISLLLTNTSFPLKLIPRDLTNRTNIP